MSITVSALQLEPEFKNKDRNLKEIESLIRQSAKEGARLIVAPEMATTGYIWDNPDDIKPYVEPILGPTTELMCNIAKELNVYIVIGLPEIDEKTNIYYNSAVLVGPKGFIGSYRKVHPYAAEPLWAKNGDEGFKVFDTDIGRIGLVICMDMTFFESTRILQLKDCEIICGLVNWFGEVTPSPLWITRAFETGCPVIVSNRWRKERDTDFAGGSTVIDEEGNVLVSKDRGDGFVLADLDIAKIRAKKAKASKRAKYSFYNELSLSTYRWNPMNFFTQTCSSFPKGDRFNASAIQVDCGLMIDMDKRLDCISKIIEQESGRGSRLIVLPELYLSGIVSSYDEAKANSISFEELDSKFKTIIDNCNTYSSYIVIGGIEEKNNVLHNTAWLVGPEGVLGSYHKINLDTNDKDWAKSGSNLFVYDLPIGRIGIIIGEELAIPEFSRINAIRGVEVLAVPAAINKDYVKDFDLVDSNRKVQWHLARIRAIENNFYTVFSNYTGRGYIGKSGIFGPDAAWIEGDEAIIDSRNERGSVCFNIDTKNVNQDFPTNRVKAKQLLNLREPYWYTELWL